MYLPPPPPLSKEEWKKSGGRDLAFDKWYRYESHPFGFLLWLKDKIQNKGCKNHFKGDKMKFKYHDEVIVTGGFFKGLTGVVLDTEIRLRDGRTQYYYVEMNWHDYFNATSPVAWISESGLKENK